MAYSREMKMKKIWILLSVLFFAALMSCKQDAGGNTSLLGIEIEAFPAKINYRKGDSADYSGLSVKANFSDGTSRLLDSEEYSINPSSGSILNETGSNPIKITCEGKTAFFVVSVDEVHSECLEISSLPNELNYFTNGILDLSGLEVKMNYTDGSSKLLDSSEYTTEPALESILKEEGWQPVKITSDGKTSFFTIYVGKTVLTSLKITKMPDKTYYTTGDYFDVKGLEVTAVFNSGSGIKEKILEYGEYKISKYDGTKLTEAGSGQKVEITYASKSTFFVINVGGTWESLSFTYNESDNTISVADGSGNIVRTCQNSDMIPEDVTWQGNTNLKSITIAEGIKGVSVAAFRGCTALESVAFPSSCSSIRNDAFSGCASLKSISLSPSSGGSCEFGKRCFKDCENLREIDFGSSQEQERRKNISFNESSFENCASLVELNLKNLSLSCGDAIWDGNNIKGNFYGCTSLTTVDFENSTGSVNFDNCPVLATVKNAIYCSVYRDCPALTSIPVSDKCTSIPDMAFSGCTGLTEVVVPDSVLYIGGSAFSNCINLSKITLPKYLENLSGRLFKGCTNLMEIVIPDFVREISIGAFEDCSNLSKVVFPKDLKTICNDAFKNCTSLQAEIVIPSSVVEIQYSAFENCSEITKVSIQNVDISVDWSAFWGCKNLKEINYAGTKEQFKKTGLSLEKGVTVVCSDGTFVIGTEETE